MSFVTKKFFFYKKREDEFNANLKQICLVNYTLIVKWFQSNASHHTICKTSCYTERKMKTLIIINIFYSMSAF